MPKIKKSQVSKEEKHIISQEEYDYPSRISHRCLYMVDKGQDKAASTVKEEKSLKTFSDMQGLKIYLPNPFQEFKGSAPARDGTRSLERERSNSKETLMQAGSKNSRRPTAERNLERNQGGWKRSPGGETFLRLQSAQPNIDSQWRAKNQNKQAESAVTGEGHCTHINPTTWLRKLGLQNKCKYQRPAEVKETRKKNPKMLIFFYLRQEWSEFLHTSTPTKHNQNKQASECLKSLKRVSSRLSVQRRLERQGGTRGHCRFSPRGIYWLLKGSWAAGSLAEGGDSCTGTVQRFQWSQRDWEVLRSECSLQNSCWIELLL